MQSIKDFWNKGFVGKLIIIVMPFVVVCLCCPLCVVMVSAIGRTPTPTVDVQARQTHAARTASAEAAQTETARPTLTITQTLTITSTLTLTPDLTFTPSVTYTSSPTSTVTRTRTATLAPSATARPSATRQPVIVAPTSKSGGGGGGGGGCNPAYPSLCLTHEVDCKDIPYKRFQVLPPDPYGLDRDGDGIGCES